LQIGSAGNKKKNSILAKLRISRFSDQKSKRTKKIRKYPKNLKKSKMSRKNPTKKNAK
jgi:hypothetical protein